ncbi:MAG: rhomboid family intramembrane serine protease [Paludibacteraceae bacterium]
MLTVLIISVTSIISFVAFNNNALTNKLIFYPAEIKNGGWYRFITYGVLHADLTHLIFNMFTLYFFGSYIEDFFKTILGTRQGSLWYIVLYISALVISIFPTYIKESNNSFYRSLGASGAVSAIVFAYILINPMSFMGMMFIPVMLPAFLFGIIYVIISVYLEKKQAGNINHTAHIAGGIYGMAFTIILFALLANLNILQHFTDQIQISTIRDIIHIGY